MYSTCLFCQQDLGSNETFETFPVGRRLAYDPAKGRLWVVCRRCARWNLTPLEERWEAIEVAERRFRDTRLKAGTGEISLARLPEGTELVRVGKPPRLELAAWRYGDQFRRRRTRGLIVAGTVAAAGVIATGGMMWAGMSTVMGFNFARMAIRSSRRGFSWVTVARVRLPAGGVLAVKPRHLARARLGSTDQGALKLMLGPEVLEGKVAQDALGNLLPAVNRLGATEDQVRHALQRIDAAGSVDTFYAQLARRGARLTATEKPSVFHDPGDFGFNSEANAEHEGGLFALPPTLALAIEMVSHEDLERQALEGDLGALEDAWREAEEVAQIADNLLLPGDLEARLEKLKKRLRG